jgi:hypothetical protein
VARVDVVGAVVEGVEFVEDGPAVAVDHGTPFAGTADLVRGGVDADGGMRSDPDEVVLNDPLKPVLTQGR